MIIPHKEKSIHKSSFVSEELKKALKQPKAFSVCRSIFILLSFFICISLFILGGLIIATFVILSSINSTKMLNRTQKLALTSIKNFFQKYFGQGKKIIDSHTDYLHDMEGKLDLTFNDSTEFGEYSMSEVGKQQLRLAQSHDLVSFIGFVQDSGKFLVCGDISCYMRNLTNVLYTEDDETVGTLWKRDFDDDCQPINDYYPVLTPFDFRNTSHSDPWYIKAIRTDDYVWENFEIALGWLSSTMAYRYYDSKGNFVGALAVWFILAEVDSFLEEMDYLDSNIYVVSVDDGKLIATTTSEDYFIYQDDGKKIRPFANQSSDYIVRSSISVLIGKYGSVEDVKEMFQPFLYVDDYGISRYVSTAVCDISNFRVLIVVVRNFIDVFKNVLVALLISSLISFLLICIVIFILLGILVIFFFPLFSLIGEMKKVEEMDLSDIKIGKSWFLEISLLQERFSKTVETLIEWRKFLPLSMLKELKNKKEEEKHPESLKSEMTGASISTVSTDNKSCDSSNSSNNSFSENSSKGNSGAMFFNLFKQGVRLEKMIFVKVVLFNVYEIFQRGMFEEFSIAYSKILEKLDETVKRGQILKTEGNEFVIVYKSDCIISALADLFNFCKFLNGLVLKSSFGGLFSYNAIVDMDEFFQGVIGSDTKTQTCQTKLSRIYDDIMDNVDLNKVVVTEKLQKEKPDQFVTRWFGFVKRKDKNKILPIFILSSFEEFENDEWMYELSIISKQKKYNKLNNCWWKMKNHEFSDALKDLKEYTTENAIMAQDESVKLLFSMLSRLENVSENIEEEMRKEVEIFSSQRRKLLLREIQLKEQLM